MGAPPALRAARPLSARTTRCERFELAVELTGAWSNPFDPEEIDLYALFVSPSGRTNRVNGFYTQAFTRRLEGDREKLEPAGEPGWRIRFAPDAPGTWQYRVVARDRSGSAELSPATFEVTSSASRGFIRRAPRNPLAFAWDNGQPFFAVGENLCWAGGRGTEDYETWLPELARGGGNWIRIWMSSWNCALEWSEQDRGDLRSGAYRGVGVYSLDNAWKLDRILDLAASQDIQAMLCLGTYGEFKDGGFFNEGQWKGNPYSTANGGPCAKPEDFWTDPAARKLYQRRLRYLAARYGDRTNLHAWEFWNEAQAPAAWVQEMARFLKGTGEFQGRPADPYGHLVTTTYGTPEVWRIPEIDFSQTHTYGKADIPDFGPGIRRDAAIHAAFGKPHLLAEFGIDWRAPDTKYDSNHAGVHLHNALWASAVSGNAGGAMIWWWDSYVHPGKLYSQFAPLRRFVDAVPWTDPDWAPLKFEPAPVELHGIGNRRLALLWAQNPASTWKNRFEEREVPPVPATEIVLLGLPPGRYSVEWWDTWKGGIARTELAEGTQGTLRLRLPELAQDIAARLVRAE